MFVVKLEAPSSPQGWLLHSDCAAPLVIFPLPPSSLCCDGLCLLEQHTHLGAATCNQKLKQGLSTHGYYQKGGLELLLRSKLVSEWTNLTISWMFLLHSSIATGCATLKEPQWTQEVLAGIDKVIGCPFDTLIMKKRIMGKF